MLRRWLLACFLIGVLVGVLGSVTYWRVIVEHGPESCITGTTTLAVNAWQYQVIGSQELCGRDLHWGPAIGPATKEDLERIEPGAQKGGR